MKNLSWLATIVLLVACNKNPGKKPVTEQQNEKQSCDFGISNFNFTKRAPVAISDESANKNPHRPPTGTGTTTSNAGVILLDFDGQYVSGTQWNYDVGNFTCAPANLTGSQVAEIVQRVTNDYGAFNIIVTTDEAVYSAANIYKRQRVIVTETWEWFGQAGGTSLLNTFIQGTNTPCFVFSSLLNYQAKNIAEACSHEAGHTLGLRHQSVYDGNCIKVNEYNGGQGSGEIGWAPIMGNSYYQNLSLWHKGPNSLGCSNIQDDVAIIAGIVGFKTDDYSNSTTGAASLSASLNGVLNNSSDVDYFYVNTSVAKTVSVIPLNVGIYNSGANEDIVLNVYNAQGLFIASSNDASVLNASVSLNAGNYYISVASTSNAFTNNYGMLGLYTVSVN